MGKAVGLAGWLGKSGQLMHIHAEEGCIAGRLTLCSRNPSVLH